IAATRWSERRGKWPLFSERHAPSPKTASYNLSTPTSTRRCGRDKAEEFYPESDESDEKRQKIIKIKEKGGGRGRIGIRTRLFHFRSNSIIFSSAFIRLIRLIRGQTLPFFFGIIPCGMVSSSEACTCRVRYRLCKRCCSACFCLPASG